MQKSANRFLMEVIWLALSLGLTVLLSLLIGGRTAFSNTVDIHVGDTYFILEPFRVWLPLFLLITFLLYFIKEFRYSFQRTGSNRVLVIIGIALIIALTLLVSTFSGFCSGDWTVYPPLSALKPEKTQGLTQDPVTKSIINFFTVLQGVVLIMLLFVTFRWGAKKQAGNI
ncbi:hypothetical protein ACFS6H_00755 [Terrimonas rubra]|uniref:Uncharacterized protein n=1 Tax=Terrimonas rubra TaxID=1035890 RepID=A0ABW5ZYU6_9BACT